MTTTVYLIRHATYESPDNILPSCLPGFALSAVGREQVKQLAQYFKKKSIAAIYTSPLTRTRQTAEIIAKTLGLQIVTDERLLEVRSGLGGQKEGFIESIGGWLYTTKWHRDHNGETPEEIVARMEGSIEEKVRDHSGKEIIIVSHGDPMMFLVTSYQGHPLTKSGMAKIPYVAMGNGFELKFDEHNAFLSSKSLTP